MAAVVAEAALPVEGAEVAAEHEGVAVAVQEVLVPRSLSSLIDTVVFSSPKGRKMSLSPKISFQETLSMERRKSR